MLPDVDPVWLSGALLGVVFLVAPFDVAIAFLYRAVREAGGDD